MPITDAKRAANAKYYAQNRDVCSAMNEAWQTAHAAQFAACKAEWHARHRDARLAAMKARYAAVRAARLAFVDTPVTTEQTMST